MRKYTLSGADSFTHVPEHPERTAHKAAYGHLNFDRVYQVWPNRASLARTIRMQERREPRQDDWRPCVKLGLSEGY
jgi:hypothetical protein